MAKVSTIGVVLLTAFALSSALQDRPKKNRNKHKQAATKTDAAPAAAVSHSARSHSNKVAGMHLNRVTFVQEGWANATFTVGDEKQCSGKKDAVGQTQCHFNLGDTLDLKMGWARKAIQRGSTFEIDLVLDMTGTEGLAKHIQVDPIHMKCPFCGEMCEFNIPRGNGTQLVPTQDDLEKMPLVGMAMLTMAKAGNLQLPQNRSVLSDQINKVLAMASMLKPGLFEETAFKADNEKFVWGPKTIRFPLPKCPLEQLQLPPLHTPSGAVTLSMDTNSFGLKAVLPDMDILDTVEGIADIGFRIKENSKPLLSLATSVSFNKMAKSTEQLQLGLDAHAI